MSITRLRHIYCITDPSGEPEDSGTEHELEGGASRDGGGRAVCHTLIWMIVPNVQLPANVEDQVYETLTAEDERELGFILNHEESR
ncbi:hypothetical protein B1400_1363 [Bifidobacterium italicum]|uniref:Uncharacterized protein n=1 Tax=Bifidobacterium italicum TaxID=1960968 RepID=A0A2A2EII1_9BIFI|nr:hypothetical protein [Bifidobacterium italicum]PAU68745.1 hypothetical protein B1400_1363 [Bifidobacterium italicum]